MISNRFKISFSVFLLAASMTASASLVKKINFPVEKIKLKNGMTVLLHQDRSIPMISFHQWYRVGSRHEKPGRTGLAHFFEHLMFKGTKKISRDQLEVLIQANGGSNNAFTSRDYTGYYVDFPSGQLELAMQIESDRMRNLIFDMAAIQSEREVVKEERRMRVEDSVDGSIMEATYSTVFKAHPYRWPVIGYMADLNAATIEDLKEFYRAYYAPNNTVLVVAGDFELSKAKSLVNKYYGSIKSETEDTTETPPKTDSDIGVSFVTIEGGKRFSFDSLGLKNFTYSPSIAITSASYSDDAKDAGLESSTSVQLNVLKFDILF